MRTLGIVMAKSESVRCPDKNIAMICGKPVLSYPIGILRASKVCERVMVSTDSPYYLEVAEKYADSVVMRESGWDDYPYFEVSVNESRKKHERITGERFDNIVFVGANVMFLRPSWVRTALDILLNYHYNDMPIDLVTNDMDTCPVGVCRIIRDGVVRPNTYKFNHSGILCDFDFPDELELAKQVMGAIQEDSIHYPLDETVHDDRLKMIDKSPNHFRGLKCVS